MSDETTDGALEPKEVARVRRRDRAAEAEARDLLRPGMGKVFKQILDAQATAAKAPPAKKRKRRRRKS
jgi:anti-sigma factor RsiW